MAAILLDTTVVIDLLRGRPEAVQRLTEPGAAQQSVGPVGWLFLAMAHARLGNAAEARQWLEKATTWIEEDANRFDWGVRLILQHLRREAEALIPLAGAR